MLSQIKPMLFMLNVFFIFITELFRYLMYFKDYSLFIDGLTNRLASINILYVKIFQAFALNNSLIDDATNNKLLEFTDNAPWNLSDINYVELTKMAEEYEFTLSDKWNIPIFPINSGMISLVFKVYDKNNKPFIAKMKRNNIEIKLNEAIDNLLYFMYLLSFIPVINKYQLAEVVNKNIEIIRHQTNFLEEVDNMHKIRENCKHLKYIKIPNADRKITEKYSNIIVMDYIDGMKVNQLEENDYEGFAKQVIKFGIVTTILHGFTHGDLHSGNILFIKDKADTKYPYKIGVIDFGIIYKLDSNYKGLLFDIFTQMFYMPPRETAEKILNSGIIEPVGILSIIPKSNYNTIVDFTEVIINDTIKMSHKANQLQIYEFLSKLKEYLSKTELMNLGIKPSDDFIKSQLVLAMAHGVTLTLCKENYITLMDKVINELFNTKILLKNE